MGHWSPPARIPFHVGVLRLQVSVPGLGNARGHQRAAQALKDRIRARHNVSCVLLVDPESSSSVIMVVTGAAADPIVLEQVLSRVSLLVNSDGRVIVHEEWRELRRGDHVESMWASEEDADDWG